jgi:hypothetical protein
MAMTSTSARAMLAGALLTLTLAMPAAAQEQPTTLAPVDDSTDALLDSLDARITRLEDQNAIERLQRTYGYFVDKGQWTRLSELFAQGGTLEIGGKGIFVGQDRVLEYMQTAFGQDGAPVGMITQHMQFQTVVNTAPDGQTGWLRGRAFVMASSGWGLPLYEDEFEKGEDGIWRISRLTGPFTMYTNWQGWGENALNNTWPDKFPPAPDLPPSTVYLTYPAYYIAPFHYPNPVTGEAFRPDAGTVGAYHRPPGTAEQIESLGVGRQVDGTQAIALPPRE